MKKKKRITQFLSLKTIEDPQEPISNANMSDFLEKLATSRGAEDFQHQQVRSIPLNNRQV